MVARFHIQRVQKPTRERKGDMKRYNHSHCSDSLVFHFILSKEHKFTLTKLLIGYRKYFVEKYLSNHLSNVFNFRFFSGLCFQYVSSLLFPSEIN